MFLGGIERGSGIKWIKVLKHMIPKMENLRAKVTYALTSRNNKWMFFWQSLTKEVLYLRWNERHLRFYFETLIILSQT